MLQIAGAPKFVLGYLVIYTPVNQISPHFSVQLYFLKCGTGCPVFRVDFQKSLKHFCSPRLNSQFIIHYTGEKQHLYKFSLPLTRTDVGPLYLHPENLAQYVRD